MTYASQISDLAQLTEEALQDQGLTNDPTNYTITVFANRRSAQY